MTSSPFAMANCHKGEEVEDVFSFPCFSQDGSMGIPWGSHGDGAHPQEMQMVFHMGKSSNKVGTEVDCRWILDHLDPMEFFPSCGIFIFFMSFEWGESSFLCRRVLKINIRGFDAQDDESEGVCMRLPTVSQNYPDSNPSMDSGSFAQEFVKLFNAEIENFYASKIPARRPNSMNNYGAQATKIVVYAHIAWQKKVLITPVLYLFYGNFNKGIPIKIIEPVDLRNPNLTHTRFDSSTRGHHLVPRECFNHGRLPMKFQG